MGRTLLRLLKGIFNLVAQIVLNALAIIADDKDLSGNVKLFQR